MIFQLPYVAFPESPPVYNMTDYNHFRGYLHSEKLRWSYGAIRGRLTDQWQKEVTQKGTIDMVDNLSVAGFSGVYVNTDGYADFGRDITSNLSRILTTKPIVSDDGKLFFFDMSVYNSGKLNRSVN
jgi:phosphoglycerol transferase